jgi:hypothetical protein
LQQRDRLQNQSSQQTVHVQALRSQLEELETALQSERERQETHIRAIEDRSHQEIDLARQDAKLWQQRHESAERAHRDTTAAAQTRSDSLNGKLRDIEQGAARVKGDTVKRDDMVNWLDDMVKW